jgi:hypothetical protein
MHVSNIHLSVESGNATGAEVKQSLNVCIITWGASNLNFA